MSGCTSAPKTAPTRDSSADVQLKHSTRRTLEGWTASGLEKTIKGFANRYAKLLERFPADDVEDSQSASRDGAVITRFVIGSLIAVMVRNSHGFTYQEGVVAWSSVLPVVFGILLDPHLIAF